MSEITIRMLNLGSDSEKPICLYYEDNDGFTSLVGTLESLCLDVDQDTKLLQNCWVLDVSDDLDEDIRLEVLNYLTPLPFIMIKNNDGEPSSEAPFVGGVTITE